MSAKCERFIDTAAAPRTAGGDDGGMQAAVADRHSLSVCEDSLVDCCQTWSVKQSVLALQLRAALATLKLCSVSRPVFHPGMFTPSLAMTFRLSDYT